MYHTLCFGLIVVSLAGIESSQISSRNKDPSGELCNNTFEFDIFKKSHDIIGGSFECGDKSVGCTHQVNLNLTFSSKLPDGLDEQSVSEIYDYFRKELSGNIYETRTKTGIYTCNINPGYRVQLLFKPEFNVISGDLIKCCPSMSVCANSSFEIMIPLKNDLDNGIAGRVICHVTPAANITVLESSCSADKLKSGKAFDAIGDTLHKVIVNAPSNGIQTIEHTIIDGNQAWSLGICWNNLEKANCRSCLQYLVDKIWSHCGNAQEAQLWVPDCGLRYSMRLLNDSSFALSFADHYQN